MVLIEALGNISQKDISFLTIVSIKSMNASSSVRLKLEFQLSEEFEWEKNSRSLSSSGVIGECFNQWFCLEDKRIGRLSPSRIFSCKLFFSCLIDDQYLWTFHPVHIIWKAKVPSKVQLFASSLVLGKLSTSVVFHRCNLLCACLPLAVSCVREMVKVWIICFALSCSWSVVV